MVNRPTQRAAAIPGVVDWFDVEEGWGAIAAPEVRGGCFVHYSHIHSDGFRQLVTGQRVHFTDNEHGQDGYPFSAVDVWPDL